MDLPYGPAPYHVRRDEAAASMVRVACLSERKCWALRATQRKHEGRGQRLLVDIFERRCLERHSWQLPDSTANDQAAQLS